MTKNKFLVPGAGTGARPYWLEASVGRLCLPFTESQHKFRPNAGDDISVAGNDISIAGDDISVAGDDISVAGDDISVAGQYKGIAGDDISIGGHCKRIAGDSKGIAGQYKRIAGDDRDRPCRSKTLDELRRRVHEIEERACWGN